MVRLTSASSASAPIRYSSAKPRMPASGVRSSWLASATKRRICSSDSARAANADSIWASMPLSAERQPAGLGARRRLRHPVRQRAPGGDLRRGRLDPAQRPQPGPYREPARRRRAAATTRPPISRKAVLSRLGGGGHVVQGGGDHDARGRCERGPSRVTARVAPRAGRPARSAPASCRRRGRWPRRTACPAWARSAAASIVGHSGRGSLAATGSRNWSETCPSAADERHHELARQPRPAAAGTVPGPVPEKSGPAPTPSVPPAPPGPPPGRTYRGAGSPSVPSRRASGCPYRSSCWSTRCTSWPRTEPRTTCR